MVQFLYKKEIEEIKDSGYLNKKHSITDALIDSFYNEILKDNERQILELAFSNEPSQEDLNNLLSVWDIEVKGANKSLMLAYIMKMFPEVQFTKYEEPRLNGLLKYYKFQNLGKVAHYSKIGKALNKEGIIPMILKGGAMRHIRPELPRIMGDIDILVPEKVFIKSADIACTLGYTYDKVDIHAIDLHKKDSDEGILDIHKFIYMESGHEKKLLKNLYKRARKENVFGVETLVPSNEDLLFIALVNLARNLRNKTSQAGLLYTLFDCKFLQESKPDFDWNIVIENAKITKTKIQLNFAIKFLKKISENVFPEMLNDDILFERETTNYSNMVMFERFYLEDLRLKCRAMKLGEVIQTPTKWAEYITLKSKYQFLKGLRKHPLLIELLIKDLKTRKYEFEE